MARLAIESQAAPAAQGPIENRVQDLAVMLMAALGCLALLDPGVLLGAVVAGGWLWLYRPPAAQRLVCALLLLVPLLALHDYLGGRLRRNDDNKTAELVSIYPLSSRALSRVSTDIMESLDLARQSNDIARGGQWA